VEFDFFGGTFAHGMELDDAGVEITRKEEARKAILGKIL